MWRTALDWLTSKDRPPLEDATYEELFSESFTHDVACREISRRLTPIVHAMSIAKTRNQAQASELTGMVFREFVYRFPVKAEMFGLAQTASIIRDVIGDKDFYVSKLPLLYYAQLPLYHIPHKMQRYDVGAMLDKGLAASADIVTEVASEVSGSEMAVERDTREGWKELARVMREDFEHDDLKASTEGFLPW